MRLLICAPLLLAACLGSGDELEPDSVIRQIGRLQNARLDEASGLARSALDPDLLWSVNDDGPPVLYAVGHDGTHLGRVTISGAKNTDWEDLAAFSFENRSFLVVADIGDNDARRKHVSLYVVQEPAAQDDSVAIAWTIDFTYPDGPRDAESLAVDAAGGQIYVLSKRDIPAVLYTLPLQPGNDGIVVATRLAALDTLPQPSQQQTIHAASSGWAWQPTAMDFSADGRSALILTYQGVYFYRRSERQTWAQALGGTPLELRLEGIVQAESIALAASGEKAFLTIEKKHAPIWKIDLSSAKKRPT